MLFPVIIPFLMLSPQPESGIYEDSKTCRGVYGSRTSPGIRFWIPGDMLFVMFSSCSPALGFVLFPRNGIHVAGIILEPTDALAQLLREGAPTVRLSVTDILGSSAPAPRAECTRKNRSGIKPFLISIPDPDREAVPVLFVRFDRGNGDFAKPEIQRIQGPGRVFAVQKSDIGNINTAGDVNAFIKIQLIPRG